MGGTSFGNGCDHIVSSFPTFPTNLILGNNNNGDVENYEAPKMQEYSTTEEEFYNADAVPAVVSSREIVCTGDYSSRYSIIFKGRCFFLNFKF